MKLSDWFKILFSVSMFSFGASSCFVTPPVGTSLDSIRENSVWNGTLSTIICGLVGALCKGMMGVNKFDIYNQKRLLLSLDEAKTSRNRGVLTASNHLSVIDDPVGIVSLVPFTHVIDVTRLRWTLGAKDVMFTNPFSSRFFTLGQVISTERGGGLYQPAIQESVDKLNKGKWVHIFPEGKINQELDETLLLPMKPGVGKIALETEKIPIIIPIYFHNMQQLMVDHKFPQVGKRVSIYIGEPINIDDIVQEFNDLDNCEKQLQNKTYYMKIANRIRDEIEILSTKLKEEQSKE